MLRPGSIEAPAKINLTLEVLAKREDGYHGIRSVMLPIGLHDVIRWQPAARFAFYCGDTAPKNGSNLVVRAIRALGIDPALEVTLEKNIPTGGGLGGGSSDGAAVLRAAAAGAFGDLGENDYLAIARSLGSDVPFFLVETGALVEGTGERVTALGALPPWWVVVIVPPLAVGTSSAYAALDAERGEGYETRPRNASPSLAMVEAVQRADFAAAIAATMNDFEAIVASREPLVAETLGTLRNSGARLVRMSGSGSSCFALAETENEARTIASRVIISSDAQLHVVPVQHAQSWR